VVNPDRRVGFGDGKGLAANQIRLNPRPVDDARDEHHIAFAIRENRVVPGCFAP
jgi:hypothetical protein